jgi:hypothetical protein
MIDIGSRKIFFGAADSKNITWKHKKNSWMIGKKPVVKITKACR